MASQVPPGPSLREALSDWARIVEEVVAGYRLGLDDWLNDMDLRQAIDEAMGRVGPDQVAAQYTEVGHLETLDAKYRAATVDAGKCLWGAAAAAQEGWHPDRHWWYFRKPRIGNDQLMREIDRVG